MKARLMMVFALSFLFVSLFFFSSLISQETPDYGKILGDWDMEVDADEEYYYLSLDFEKSDGEITGTISESTGFFTDVELSDIQFDGETLSFEFTAPTPPDGYERVVEVEFTVGEDKMEGFLSVEDLEVTASAVATREIQ